MRNAIVSLRSLAIAMVCLTAVSWADAGVSRVHKQTTPAAPPEAAGGSTTTNRALSVGATEWVRSTLQDRARLILAWTHAIGAPRVVEADPTEPAGARTRGISDGPDPIGWHSGSDGQQGHSGSEAADHRRRRSGPRYGVSSSTDPQSHNSQVEQRN